MFGFPFPIVTFELVAGMAAVDKVIESVTTTLRSRLKVVYRQFCADVHLTNAAITAAKAISLPDGLPNFLAH